MFWDLKNGKNIFSNCGVNVVYLCVSSRAADFSD